MILKLFGSRKVKLPAASRWPTPAPMASEDELRSSALKIIHAGGRVENYYMAVPATRILDKYPSFVLARPDVFRRPWEAVVRPGEILIPGQKFFVVPRCTLKKLRRRIRKPGGESSTNSSSFVPQQPPSRCQRPSRESSTYSASFVPQQPPSRCQRPSRESSTNSASFVPQQAPSRHQKPSRESSTNSSSVPPQPSKKTSADDGMSSKSFSQQIGDYSISSADESKTNGRIRTPNRRVRFLGIDTEEDSDSDSVTQEKKGYAENRVKKNPDPQPGRGKRRVRNTPTWEPSLKSITESHGCNE